MQWVSYFNGGDAVHYFARGSYGWPQSLGCVELPYTAAAQAYPYLPYGTLVGDACTPVRPLPGGPVRSVTSGPAPRLRRA